MTAPLLQGWTAWITTQLRAGLIQCGLALVITSLALASFGFAGAAAYVAIETRAGPVIALGAMAAFSGLMAFGLLVLVIRRQRRAASVPSATPLTSAPASVTVEHMLAVLAAAKGSPLTAALLATQQLGRELKPAHLMLAAFIGGFLAARKVKR